MNISEIAKLAGVSSAAVSRYFNNGYISGEKREAIRRVVEETGYRPLAQARMLRTRKTMHIGVIVPKVASSSIGHIIDGIISVLDGCGYRMLLAVTHGKAEKEIDYLRTFKDGQADGVILAGTVFTDEHREVLASMPIPVVIAGQDLDGYCSVYHDDYHAMYDMTRAMAGAGRRNLAFLGVAMQDVAAGKRRYEGYRDAVIDAGLSQSADRHLTAAFSVASGYEKAAELIGKYPDVDGIVCATDEIAAGAIRLLRARGIDVPEHILLSGVGDSDLAGIAGKSMMTIHYHYEKCGEIAASSLLGQILGKPVADKIMLGYELCCN